MDRRRLLLCRSPLFFALAATLVVGGLSGCRSRDVVGRSPAATVDGHDISRQQVQRYVDALQAYVEAVRKGGKSDPAALAAQLGRLRGTGRATVGTGGASMALGSLIDLQIVESEVRRAGGNVTGADRTAVQAQVKSQLQQAGVGSTKAFTALIDVEEGRQAALQALARVLGKGQDRTAELRAAYAQQRDGYTQLCFTAATTPDEASGQRVVERVRSGEAFQTVAAEVSTTPAPSDPAQATQCAARADVAAAIPAAAAAGVGDVLGPANNQGTWIVLQVGQVKVPTFDDIKAQLAKALPAAGTDVARRRLAQVLRRARVTVDPRYGRWDRSTGAIVAPVGPLSTTTTTAVRSATAGAGS